MNNPQDETQTPSNDNHHPFDIFNVAINQYSPLESSEGLPVANFSDNRHNKVLLTSHMEWYMDDENVLHDTGGGVSPRRWYMKTPIGDHLSFGSNITKRLSRLEVYQ
jgi:hypothetical protein